MTVLADGTKLPPMVIFKGKRLPPNLPSGIIVKMHEKAWMDENLMKIWLEEIWKNRSGGLLKKKSLLVLDSFEAHKTSQIKLAFKDENSNLAVIPGGLTSVVQPLDVCLNKPFKDRLRVKWRQWMAVGNFDLTKDGNIKKPGYNVICNWILEAWDSIPKEMVIKSFKKCGISNSMDGMEDHMIYESDGENNYETNYDREVILKDDISAYGSDIEDNENNILSN